MTATISAADPVAIVVDVPPHLLVSNPEAVDGKLLVHSGLTETGRPSGCPRCGARVRVLLPPGRYILWCSHRNGWQVRAAVPTVRAA